MNVTDGGSAKSVKAPSSSNADKPKPADTTVASKPAARPPDKDSFEAAPAANKPAALTTTTTTAKATVTGAAPAQAVQATGTGATDAAIATQVKQEVTAASANGADAAQLMTLAHQRAVELVRQQYPNAPPTERMDRAVAIATYVLDGPAQIDNLAQVDSGKTKTVPYMRDIAANDPQGAAFAGMNLDHTHGGGTFYSSYSDGTDNQAFHTNFFVAAGYVAGGDPAMTAKAQGGNVFHETLDRDAWGNGGGSMADYAASSSGIITGGQLIQARNYAAEYEAGQHPSGANIDLMEPVLVAGFVSKTGTQAPRVAGMNQAQQQGADQAMKDISDFRSSFFFQLATEKNPVAALMVGFFEIPPILRGTKPGFN